MAKTSQRKPRSQEPLSRPKLREVEVDSLLDGTPKKKQGANLNDVLGGIIWDEMQQRDVGQVEIGRIMGGISQQHVSNLLRREKGTSLDVLSRVCAALQESPDVFFLRHERYLKEKPEQVQERFAVDRVYNRFRSIIGVDTARRLAEILDALNRSSDDAIETFLRSGEQMAGLHMRSPKGSEDGAKPRRRKARR